MRATFAPDSASGVAQPMMTSSIDSGGSAGTRLSKSAMTAAALSSGRVVRSAPRGALPTAVRTPATITASFIIASSGLCLKLVIALGSGQYRER